MGKPHLLVNRNNQGIFVALMVKAFGCVMSNLPKRARTKKNKINEV